MFFEDGQQIRPGQSIKANSAKYVQVALKTITFTDKVSKEKVGACDMFYYGETLTGKTNSSLANSLGQ